MKTEDEIKKKYEEMLKHTELLMNKKYYIYYFVYVLVLIFFTACNTECKKVDKSFRPHIVTHHHKSKVYRYYHTTPCSKCISVADDLIRDKRNVVEYLDNDEVVH